MLRTVGRTPGCVSGRSGVKPRFAMLLLLCAPVAAHALDHDRLVAELARRAMDDEMARADGYIYGMDVGQALTELAHAGRREPYGKLRALGLERLVYRSAENPWADGFVVWRIKAGTAPDASGTAEALRLAEGLRAGARRLGYAADLEASRDILRAYLKHAYVDRGVWLVRNYFNFGTRSFASNSYLFGYDADLLRQAADDDPAFAEAAGHTAKMIAGLATREGFLEEILQPEILTAFPVGVPPAFSPNGIRSVLNSCTVLERATAVAPDPGRRLLALITAELDRQQAAGARVPRLPLYWQFDQPLEKHRAGIATYGCLARLAHRLRHPVAGRLGALVQRELGRSAGPLPLYDLIEATYTARLLSPPAGKP
jgi:hypothetical protein